MVHKVLYTVLSYLFFVLIYNTELIAKILTEEEIEQAKTLTLSRISFEDYKTLLKTIKLARNIG